MINRILHSCSCIIEFIKLIGKKCQDARQSLASYLFPPTHLINSIIHEHLCSVYSLVSDSVAVLFSSPIEKVTSFQLPEAFIIINTVFILINAPSIFILINAPSHFKWGNFVQMPLKIALRH